MFEYPCKTLKERQLTRPLTIGEFLKGDFDDDMADELVQENDKEYMSISDIQEQVEGQFVCQQRKIFISLKVARPLHEIKIKINKK